MAAPLQATEQKPTLINFSDTKTAFAAKSNSDLNRAYFLFRAMQNKALVKIGGALTRLALWLHLPITGIIKKTIYRHFCGGTTVEEALTTARKLQYYNVQTVLDYAAEGGDNEESFNDVAQRILNNIKMAELHPEITCISIKMTGIGSKHIFEKLNLGEQLNIHEREAYHRIEERLDLICDEAHHAGLIIYIDAEETWLQDPIDALAEKMMQKYNLYQPIVFNTLQMYRTDRLEYCRRQIELARENRYLAGIKIVRGAYHEKEKLRAQEKHYTNPVFNTKTETDTSFDGAIDLCLNNLDVTALCVASHNEQSTDYTLQQIEKRNLFDYQHRIFFSQLFGMSDNLTFNLANAGWHASKYLPYGDVRTAIPYLLRRAEENTSIAGQMGRELRLIKIERERRKHQQVS